MELIKKLGRNILFNFTTKEEVAFESFWADSPVVVTFLRRFGWVFCRLGAKELSEIKPLLEQSNVRLIGVGLEELGVEEFVSGNFFAGELFLDTQKKSYDDIGFKRFNFLSMIPEFLKKVTKDAMTRSKEVGIQGNMAGDGMQTGGTIVISKGGAEVLYLFKQTTFADHASNDAILKSLGIEPQVTASASTDSPEIASASSSALPTCDEK